MLRLRDDLMMIQQLRIPLNSAEANGLNLPEKRLCVAGSGGAICFVMFFVATALDGGYHA